MTRAALTALLLLSVITLACTDDPKPTPSPTAAASETAATDPSVTTTPGTTPTPFPEPPISAAIDALATWLGPVADPASIQVASTEDVTWSNGCLDLSRVGQMCTEALVAGYRIMLSLGDATYEVRTDASGRQTAWAPQIEILVRFTEASTNLATFTTDDGNQLSMQLVPGTSFGVDLAILEAGTPVGIAIADAPQSGAPLLVWVDPFQLN
ncbi:MAG: hypothetical protein HOH95_06695 [Dehalococcoidia bacterium]|nr:hypothetical protein [Dehalococcoidia bacterium]